MVNGKIRIEIRSLEREEGSRVGMSKMDVPAEIDAGKGPPCALN